MISDKIYTASTEYPSQKTNFFNFTCIDTIQNSAHVNTQNNFKYQTASLK
jgi:hypothetical protein